jgi:hypothetical protein
MLNNDSERKEPIYWVAYQMARAVSKEGIAWGIKPAYMLGALNDGFEAALKDHRDAIDQANSGH